MEYSKSFRFPHLTPTSREVDDDAEGGLDLVVLGADFALVVDDDQSGGVEVLAGLEVEEEVAPQPTPSLHGN